MILKFIIVFLAVDGLAVVNSKAIERSAQPSLTHGLFSNITEEMDTVYDLLQGEISDQSVDDIFLIIFDLQSRIQEISPEIQNDLLHQPPKESIDQYYELTHKLEFQLNFFVREIQLEDDTFAPKKLSKNWAEEMLSLNDGLEALLDEFHLIIVGENLFARRSIFSAGDMVNRQRLGEYTLSLQAASYALLVNALYIKGRDMTGIQEMQANNIQAQTEFLNGIYSFWPGGSWGLPMPASGCPTDQDITWSHGYLYQDSEDSTNRNGWSETNHFVYTGQNVKNYFCMTTNGGQNTWPAGDYCIYAKDGCPNGFSCGYLIWDDEDSGNANNHNGTLPDGTYNSDITQINFACRNDGSVDDEIVLPAASPFYLFRYNDACQRVRNTVVTMEWLKWDNQDSGNNDVNVPPHPFEDGGDHDHKLYYCYYDPTFFNSP